MRAINYFQDKFKNIKNRVDPKVKYLTDNTIAGRDLSESELNQITKLVGFLDQERIEIIYSNTATYEPKKNVLVGITNYRVFKIEDDAISKTLRSEILDIKHIHNDIFSWDKLQCDLQNGNSVTFGIFHSQACKYFCQYLKGNISHEGEARPTYVFSSPISIPNLQRQNAGSPKSNPYNTGNLYYPIGTPIVFKESLIANPQSSPLQNGSQCPPNSPMTVVGSPDVVFKPAQSDVNLMQNLSPPSLSDSE